MRRLLKRLLILLAVLVFALIVSIAVTFTLYKGTPDWYAPPIPPAQRARLAQQAESKLTETQNWATFIHGDAIRAQRASQSSAPQPGTRATDSHEVRINQDELNALFDKWSTVYGWESQYAQYLDHPRIILQKDRLILAATVKTFGAVTSFHFAPRLDENSQLHLELIEVMGGRLPLPDAVWTAQKKQIVDGLQWRIPTWQPTARIDDKGAASASAMSVTLARLVIRTASAQPADPILFLPLAEGSRSVPVTITELAIEPESLMLRVRKLSAAERVKLINKIRASK